MNQQTQSKDQPSLPISNLSKLSYKPNDIILRVIDDFYKLYTQLYMPAILKSDLKEATLKAVEGYFYTIACSAVVLSETKKRDFGRDAAHNVGLIIHKHCEGKGCDAQLPYIAEVKEILYRIFPSLQEVQLTEDTNEHNEQSSNQA